MPLTKEVLRKRFAKDWKKFYQVKYLEEQGFKRRTCKNCGNHFWSIEARDVCSDSTCVGYKFIGEKYSRKKLSYTETWDAVKDYFVKTGHAYVEPYPVVARWRDDLYFTNSSIADFQPYVVKGEIEAPGNPLIIMQPCIRFPDMAQVGVSGRHHTNFVMIGQHAFNTPKTGLFYWKDQALEHDFTFLTKVLGIKPELISFKEDAWLGGGNFGACIEYYVDGLELGNCVFMQFEETKDGKGKELETKVIDMGAGLERFAWITHTLPNSYEVAFAPVIQELKKMTGVKVNEKLLMDYAKLSGSLVLDEVKDLKKQKEVVAKKLGMSEKELFDELNPLFAVYAIADHLKTVLLAMNDGGLPSNSGGGYNLRLLLRRVFGFKDEFEWDLDYGKLINAHINLLAPVFPRLALTQTSFETGTDALHRMPELVVNVLELIEEEEKKYKSNLEKGRAKLVSRIQKAKKEKKDIPVKELITLYESNGIPLEMVEEISKEQGFKFEKPEDFYALAQKSNETVKEEEAKAWDVSKYAKTKQLYYEDQTLDEFDAKVLGIEEEWLILDKTCFYPEGGGQAPDTGVINGVQVTDVQKIDGVILHQVEDIDKFRKGQQVMARIDWDRRFRIMQHHSAAHLLNSAARELLGRHIWQGGSAKSFDKAHLDLTHYKKISEVELNKIEFLVNKRISEDLPIEIKWLPRNEAEKNYGFRLYQGGAVPGKSLRIVAVKGVDAEACGGTHLNSTGQIGYFKILKRESIQDGIERIIYACGLNAVQAMQEKEKLVKKIAETYGVPELQVSEASQRFFSEWKELKKEIHALKEKVSDALVEKAILTLKGKKVFAQFIEGTSPDTVYLTANKMIKKSPELCIALATGRPESHVLVISGQKSSVNAKQLLEKLLKEAGGSGGGSEKIAKGTTPSPERIKKALEKIQ